MRVLVTAASSHGATTNIASVIGGTLHVHGLEVDVVPLADVKTLDGYDAVILGSGVYTGHWLREALTFARRHRKQLAQKPVWLFSSGPIGDPPRPLEEPAGIAERRRPWATSSSPAGFAMTSSTSSRRWSRALSTHPRATSVIGATSTPGPTRSPKSCSRTRQFRTST